MSENPDWFDQTKKIIDSGIFWLTLALCFFILSVTLFFTQAPTRSLPVFTLCLICLMGSTNKWWIKTIVFLIGSTLLAIGYHHLL